MKYLILLSAGFLAFHCSGPADAPPDRTKAPMSAIVDGRLWIADGELIGPLSSMSRSEGRTVMIITGSRYGRGADADFINITVSNCSQDSIYVLSTDDNGFMGVRMFASYRTDSLHTGTVSITRLDTTANIIAGTFSFSAKDEGGGAVITVTDGRFNLFFKKN